MRVMCAFCHVFIDVDDDDRETVCENCGIELMVYKDGSTEVLTDGVIE